MTQEKGRKEGAGAAPTAALMRCNPQPVPASHPPRTGSVASLPSPAAGDADYLAAENERMSQRLKSVRSKTDANISDEAAGMRPLHDRYKTDEAAGMARSKAAAESKAAR